MTEPAGGGGGGGGGGDGGGDIAGELSEPPPPQAVKPHAKAVLSIEERDSVCRLDMRLGFCSDLGSTPIPLYLPPRTWVIQKTKQQRRAVSIAATQKSEDCYARRKTR